MAEPDIPRATAKRLPIYYRYLKLLLDAGTTRVSSNELSDAVKIERWRHALHMQVER